MIRYLSPYNINWFVLLVFVIYCMLMACVRNSFTYVPLSMTQRHILRCKEKKLFSMLKGVLLLPGGKSFITLEYLLRFKWAWLDFWPR